jgi:hypothetical protein
LIHWDEELHLWGLFDPEEMQILDNSNDYGARVPLKDVETLAFGILA